MQRFRAPLIGAWRRLDQPGAMRLAMFLVPLLLGLSSVVMRQDDNWDLRNYHLYNPFALLNGKIGFDLAPGQWQSYFNPTIDLPYYGMIRTLPGRLVGFLMGLLHGLNFILLVQIIRHLFAQDSRTGYRLPILLGVAGIFGSAFLSELGNTMGDNLTALFVLGSVLIVLRGWPAVSGQAPGQGKTLLWAGLVMGLGTGLKLTNATYALGLCLTLMLIPGAFGARLKRAFTFGPAVLVGIAITSGWWFWLMWTQFGNPLFPQFNNIFHSPMAAPIGIGDTHWLPQGWLEYLLWPFKFAANPKRVTEIGLTLLIWPMLYVGFLLQTFNLAQARPAEQVNDGDSALLQRQRLLLSFFAISYLLWMCLFSIYRYLIPLELLAPVVLLLLAQRLMPAPLARRAVSVLLAIVVVSTIPAASWGRAPFSANSYAMVGPVIADPEQSMVFTVHGDPPMGWLVTLFPVRLAFVALGSGFPESDAFKARVAAMIAARSGPLYVMVQAAKGSADPQAEQALRDAAPATNARVVVTAAEVLGRYGLAVDPASCRSHAAFRGKNHNDFQFCVVTPVR
ncbi:hypothetical protein [Massilia sp. S19_KUP03_FR1]|uniref:hypothetical protein n=1 Tax=Massilia sp. S19_KUP03_FR1 TaxID=3025503 RepID=UPI002FCD7517